MARLRVAVLAAVSMVAASWPARAQIEPGPAPTVILAELDGIIHPIAAEYIDEVIGRADAAAADLVVLTLRTPGGLLDSTRTIISRMIASRAPVVVFVGPSGARAASAGFLITMAADVAVMAPGTHIGAAHPVSGTGGAMDETTARKAAEDVAAYVRSLAMPRGRNIMLAAEAVMNSRAFTDTEALEATPPLIDFRARDVDDVVRQLDGWRIRRFDGGTTVARTAGAVLQAVEMTRRQRFLSAIAHPQVAYLLLTLGVLGLTVELWTPGAILPGVAGGLCLLLAFFALQILPVSTTGLLLMVFGLALLILELKVPSFGALGIGGTISLLIGSVMMTRAVPGVAVSLRLVVPVVLGLAAIMLFVGRLGLQAQRQPPSTGLQALLGRHGRARTPLDPGIPGHIDLQGEIWRAVSLVPVGAGDSVRVTAIDGLTLAVEPAGAIARQGDDEWKP